MAIGRPEPLTADERARVAAAVRAAEQGTSAEIVPMIVGRSGLYREAQYRAGLSAAFLVLAMLLTVEAAWLPWGWHASNAVWLLAATTAAYLAGAWAGRRPSVIRLLISKERMQHKVQLRAERAFAQRGIARTRDRTGLLLMVSLMERQVYVLPDHALAQHVTDAQRQAIVTALVERLQAGDLTGGICRGIETAGALLASVCPSRPGDNPDELPNELIQDV